MIVASSRPTRASGAPRQCLECEVGWREREREREREKAGKTERKSHVHNDVLRMSSSGRAAMCHVRFADLDLPMTVPNVYHAMAKGRSAHIKGNAVSVSSALLRVMDRFNRSPKCMGGALSIT